MNMTAPESGWQNFLDRLKELWGNTSGVPARALPTPARRRWYGAQLESWDNEGGAPRGPPKI